jgi:hypothetical protein
MTLEERIAALATMTPVTLREGWERMYRTPSPPGFGPDLLARAMAYSMQEKVWGGLPRHIAREIRGGVLEIAAASLSPDRPPPLRSGTRLTREWHGRTHHVHVVDGGFDYNDQRYRSLTAIAREITGAAWSGPRFFGLAAPRGA